MVSRNSCLNFPLVLSPYRIRVLVWTTGGMVWELGGRGFVVVMGGGAGFTAATELLKQTSSRGCTAADALPE